MLDLNTIRADFAQRLAADSTRFSMDAALAFVVEKAYQQGIKDGQPAPLALPPTAGEPTS